MRWRMARARAGDGTYVQMDRFGREERRYLKRGARLRDPQRAHGGERSAGRRQGRRAAGGAGRRGKLALETLFDQGLVTTATRQGFERLYDIPERVIPPEILNLADARRRRMRSARLLDLSGRALGVATEIDLRDYFRLPVAETKTALAELVEDGTLIPVSVEGWKQQAYLHRDAKLPRKAGRHRPPLPLRPRGVGAVAGREAVRLSLQDRDLYPCGQTEIRLLRAALPAPGQDRRPGLPQGRPAGRRAARQRHPP